MQNKALKSIAVIIRDLSVFVRSAPQAAGADRSAITRIMKTEIMKEDEVKEGDFIIGVI